MTIDPILVDALAYAIDLHGDQVRKGRGTPYIGHLMAVCATTLDHGGDTDQAVAALLHDAAEDRGGRRRLDAIAERFGARAALIVEACSDSLVDTTSGQPKVPWWTRKVDYVTRMQTESPLVLLVAAADKLDNARSALGDYHRRGESLWEIFDAQSGRVGQLWYYRSIAAVIDERLRDDPLVASLADKLNRTVGALVHAVERQVGVEEVAADWQSALTLVSAHSPGG